MLINSLRLIGFLFFVLHLQSCTIIKITDADGNVQVSGKLGFSTVEISNSDIGTRAYSTVFGFGTLMNGVVFGVGKEDVLILPYRDCRVVVFSEDPESVTGHIDSKDVCVFED